MKTAFKALEDLIELADTDNLVSEDEAQRRLRLLINSLESAGLTPVIHERMLRTAEELVIAHAGYINAEPFTAIVFPRDSRPGWWSCRCDMKAAAEHLRNLAAALTRVSSRADGYTAQELKREADIGRDLWQRLSKAAGLRIEQGASNRRFSNSQIRRLIQAAQEHDTRKARAAAEKWQLLLERNATG